MLSMSPELMVTRLSEVSLEQWIIQFGCARFLGCLSLSSMLVEAIVSTSEHHCNNVFTCKIEKSNSKHWDIKCINQNVLSLF